MENKLQKIYPTYYNLLIGQALWQAHYQILPITLACQVLKVKHLIADSRVVCYAKSKNHTHSVQSGQVFEIRGCKRIVINALKCFYYL